MTLEHSDKNCDRTDEAERVHKGSPLEANHAWGHARQLEQELAHMTDCYESQRHHLTEALRERNAAQSSTASNIEAMRVALQRIARWHKEFPPTGQMWDDGSPMSYSAAYGSNGERDYMRQVALNALAVAPSATTFATPAGWKLVPAKPTKQMKDAAHRCQWADKYDENPRLQPDAVYAAMLNAAPNYSAIARAESFVCRCAGDEGLLCRQWCGDAQCRSDGMESGSGVAR